MRVTSSARPNTKPMRRCSDIGRTTMSLPPGARHATRLLDQEGHRTGFVQQALPARFRWVCRAARALKTPTYIRMRVGFGYQRRNPAHIEILAARPGFSSQTHIDLAAHRRFPEPAVRGVEGEFTRAVRYLQAGVAECTHSPSTGSSVKTCPARRPDRRMPPCTQSPCRRVPRFCSSCVDDAPTPEGPPASRPECRRGRWCGCGSGCRGSCRPSCRFIESTRLASTSSTCSVHKRAGRRWRTAGWRGAGGRGRARCPLQARFPPSGGKRKCIFHPRLTTPATLAVRSNAFFDTEQDLDLNNYFAAAQNIQLARNLLVTTTHHRRESTVRARRGTTTRRTGERPGWKPSMR